MKTCRVCGLRKAEVHYSSLDSTVCKRCAADPATASPTPMYQIELDAIAAICAAVERLPPEGQARALEFAARRYVAEVRP